MQDARRDRMNAIRSETDALAGQLQAAMRRAQNALETRDFQDSLAAMQEVANLNTRMDELAREYRALEDGA